MRRLRRGAHVLEVEYRPADVVSQPLIVENELADRIRELFALPPALDAAGVLLTSKRRRARRLDRVGRSTEVVGGDVRHRGRLPRCIRGVASGSGQRSGRRTLHANEVMMVIGKEAIFVWVVGVAAS